MIQKIGYLPKIKSISGVTQPNNCYTGKSIGNVMDTNAVKSILSEMEQFIKAKSTQLSKFEYPEAYKKIVTIENKGVKNWDFPIGKLFVQEEMSGLEKRYGISNLVPFATKNDTGLLACFVADGKTNEEVVVLNSYSPLKRLYVDKCANLTEWIKSYAN